MAPPAKITCPITGEKISSSPVHVVKVFQYFDWKTEDVPFNWRRAKLFYERLGLRFEWFEGIVNHMDKMKI